MAKIGKRFKAAQAKVQADREYSVEDAAKLLADLPKAKFDETIDVAMKLGVDPRKAEENVRAVVALPHGTGKTLRVVVVCKADKQQAAKDAGADYVGAEDIIQKISEGWLDFDSLIATPDVMGLVGKVGKLLGPRGLMPNPKIGTVTPDVAKAVQAVKAGQVEFRAEKSGIVHVGAGKVSFGAQKISENLNSLIEAIVRAKPKTSKGVYLQTITVSSTMGPGIEVDPTPFRKM